MHVGIVNYGLYLPSTYETAEEIAESSGLSLEEVKGLGIERKCLPGKKDQPVVMAVKAASEALDKSGVDPSTVDVILWTGEEYKDYIAQTGAIRLQEETGCKNAWAFDLVAQGVTLILGLRVAWDIMNSDEEVNTVLLAGGTRNIDLVDYKNPHTRFLLSHSASGGAMILKRRYPKNRLLATAFVSDPEMADEVYVPGGGTEIPYAPENLRSSIMFYQANDPEKLGYYLEDRFPAALVETARKALSGRTPDYVALRHLSPLHRKRILASLSAGQSAPLSAWGHHGANDPLLSLHLGVQSGLIKERNVVILLSGGIGFNYAAAVVGWG